MEPVHPSNFLLLAASAVGVIVLGAAYALLFALARLRNRPRLIAPAYAAYGGLCACVIALAHAANLYQGDIWTVLVAAMLAGYLFAPHAALRLCTAAHESRDRP